MPTFDMVCVGTGGGPDETNLSAYVTDIRSPGPRKISLTPIDSYLLKPSQSSWQDGIIALEAGP
jgi:3',5'-cyclic-nucleotide phosphodiesterase